MKKLTASLATLALLTLFSACQQKGDEQKPPPPAGKAEQAKTATDKTAVTSIVFIGQKDCCDCTRTRIDESWKVLSEVLGQPGKVPVTRLQIDAQEKEAEVFLKQKPAQVMPGIYFLDKDGKVLSMIQGAVKKDQIEQQL